MSLNRPFRKKKVRITCEDEDDRISRLPDELIHQILSFVDTKLAVQTSVLSKRWKLIWTTLPSLKFRSDKWDSHGKYIWNKRGSPDNAAKLTRHVLNRRDHRSQISDLELAFLSKGLFERFVKYAVSHHVQCLNVRMRHDHKPYMLSNLSSNSIQKLRLEMNFKDLILGLDCWNLPALKTLHLTSYQSNYVPRKLLELFLTCLPALRTLCLEYFDLQSLSVSLSALTTLRLFMCKLPKKSWNFPALKSLTLHDVVFPEYMSDIFSTLVTLQDLTLLFKVVPIKVCCIPCPQLVNLEIETRYKSHNDVMGTIVVRAPKLSKFTSVGIFRITFSVSKLDSVNIKLCGWFDYMSYPLDKLNEYYQRLAFMLPGFAGARNLNLDLVTIEVLSSISDFLASSPSPFYNLKHVKLPHGFKEENIPDTLRSYLLGGSPRATIVTTSPQNMVPHTAVASVTAQNVVLQEPLAAPTKVLAGSENINKTACIDNVDMGVQEEHVLQNSAVNADRAKQIGAPVESVQWAGELF